MLHYSAHDHLALPRQRQGQPAAARKHSVLLLQKPAPRGLCFSHPVAQLPNYRFMNLAATPSRPHTLKTSPFAPLAALLFALTTRSSNSKYSPPPA